MPESMSWYDTGAAEWRLTSQLYVYAGGWLEVSECWIWDGTQWRRCFTGGALNTVSVVATFGANVDVSWTYTAAEPSEWLMTFEASFDFGSTWETYIPSGGDFYPDDARNPLDIPLDSLSGYTDVQDTWIRVSMKRSGADATGSPSTQFPPF